MALITQGATVEVQRPGPFQGLRGTVVSDPDPEDCVIVRFASLVRREDDADVPFEARIPRAALAPHTDTPPAPQPDPAPEPAEEPGAPDAPAEE